MCTADILLIYDTLKLWHQPQLPLSESDGGPLLLRLCLQFLSEINNNTLDL